MEELGNILRATSIQVNYDIDVNDFNRYEEMTNANYEGNVDFDQFL